MTDGYRVRKTALENVVTVTDPDGRNWIIHREDADPEHRFGPFRIAARYFDNQNQR